MKSRSPFDRIARIPFTFQDMIFTDVVDANDLKNPTPGTTRIRSLYEDEHKHKC
jgi:hypothetical protein